MAASGDPVRDLAHHDLRIQAHTSPPGGAKYSNTTKLLPAAIAAGLWLNLRKAGRGGPSLRIG